MQLPVSQELIVRQADRSREQPAVIGMMARVLLVLACVALVYGPSLFNARLQDGPDAAAAQIGRNMLRSGDWITPALNGIPVFETTPLLSWAVAASFAALGDSAWAARLPVVLAILALTWLVCRIARWSFGPREGVYAGLVFGTGAGLFWLSATLLPDVLSSGTLALALWAMLRALDEDEPRPLLWAHVFAGAIGVSLLMQGLMALASIAGTGIAFLAATRQLRRSRTWQRLQPASGAAIVGAIFLPWFLFSAFANPPYFAWTLDPRPGQFHGFAWFYLLRDYVIPERASDALPFYAFGALHLAWLAPWSAYFPAVAKLSFRAADRASQTRMLGLAWIGVGLAVTEFPAFPAFALLVGSALASDSIWIRRGSRLISVLAGTGIIAAFLWTTRILEWPGVPPQDIAAALAGAGLAVGTWTAWRWRGTARYFGIAIMMVLTLNAAQIASSGQPSTANLAPALLNGPEGRVVLGDHYFAFSAFVFEANLDRVLLLNGRYRELEYGSHAPGAPDVFLSDSQFKPLWLGPERSYLIVKTPKVLGIENLVGKDRLHLVKRSGDTHLFTNRALPQ